MSELTFQQRRALQKFMVFQESRLQKCRVCGYLTRKSACSQCGCNSMISCDHNTPAKIDKSGRKINWSDVSIGK